MGFIVSTRSSSGLENVMLEIWNHSSNSQSRWSNNNGGGRERTARAESSSTTRAKTVLENVMLEIGETGHHHHQLLVTILITTTIIVWRESDVTKWDHKDPRSWTKYKTRSQSYGKRIPLLLILPFIQEEVRYQGLCPLPNDYGEVAPS